MREDDRLPRFNRYSIPPRPGTVQCDHCPAWVKPQGVRDHMKAKHPELVRPPEEQYPAFETEEDENAYWEAQGARIALEGMDLPDGAFCAMADELGIDPY